MLFRLPQAQPNISDVMKAWFSRQDVLRPVFRLYFGTLYHPDLFLDQRFIGYVQADGAFSDPRQHREATELPNNEARRRITAIVNAVPAQYREWLKNKLRWSNELVLRRRLTDVVHHCPDVCRRLIGADDEIKAFVRTVVDTRNYYTHYDHSLERNAAKGADLYRLVVQLREIIEMPLLKELDFLATQSTAHSTAYKGTPKYTTLGPRLLTNRRRQNKNIDSDADST